MLMVKNFRCTQNLKVCHPVQRVHRVSANPSTEIVTRETVFAAQQAMQATYNGGIAGVVQW
jgi:hypothetical protein